MYMLKKIKRHLYLISIILLICAPMAFSADREILPTESSEQLRTPGVGLQDFMTRMPTEQQLASCSLASKLESDDPLDPKTGSIYLRMLWQHFEPTEGKYAWDKLDRVLECAAEKGQSVDIRLMLTYPGHKECNPDQLAIDPECIAYESLPDWLIDRVNTHTTDLFANAEYQLPDWNDSLFIEKHTALVKALGKRYNNHPDLNSVDIGSVGAWGEWHLYGASQYMPTVEQQKAIIDLYKAAFPDTPLLALADSFYQEESREFGEISTYLRDTVQTGWRGDSWGLPYFNDNRYQPINEWIPDSWKKSPVNLEVSDVIFRWAGAGFDPSLEKNTKEIQASLDDAISWHVSQFNLKGDAVPEGFKSEFQSAAKKMGFRLVLRKAIVPESATINTPVAIKLDWENVGIAPPYRDFRIALRIKDETGKIKAQMISEQSVKGWLPDQLIKTNPLLTLPADLTSGSYALEVALVFHSAISRTLPIAVVGSGNDHWYPLGAVTVVNQAPVASDASITLRQDQQAPVVVVATDPENQSLTYRVTKAPEHGELTGDLPNAVYVANENHPGEDSFSYVANDGEIDSNAATVSLSVYPVITQGTASNELELGDIAIDGDVSDWADVASFGLDGDDLSNPEAEANWQQAWMVHDKKHLYIAYQNNGPINTSVTWPWSIYLDTDSALDTGYEVNDNVSADYLISGRHLYQYTGNGSNWSWKFVASAANTVIQDDFAEISVLRTALGNPSAIRALFRADNSAMVGSYVVDNYPNGSNGFFTYELGETPVSSIVTDEVANELSDALTVDGDLADWSAIPSFGADGNDITEANSQADILEAWMAHDGSSFYIAYRNDGDINTTTMWPWQVFLDTDSDAASGLKVGNGIAAEFMIQGAGLYQYTGTGSNWSWEYLQGITYAVVGDVAEFKLARSVLGNPDDLRSILVARNSPFTGSNSSSGIDHYPDKGLGHLSYRFAESDTSAISNPIETPLSIDGDLNDWTDISPLGDDGNDVTVVDSQADFLELSLAHDTDNLYVAFTNDGPINQGKMWPWQVFFDTDALSETGYKIGTSVGGDFMLQGRRIYKYTGTGKNWSWKNVAQSEHSIVDTTAEFKILRSSLSNADTLRVVFKASNWPFTTSFAPEGFDYFPNNALSDTTGYVNYDMTQ